VEGGVRGAGGRIIQFNNNNILQENIRRVAALLAITVLLLAVTVLLLAATYLWTSCSARGTEHVAVFGSQSTWQCSGHSTGLCSRSQPHLD
jgi:hypothetical protein